MPGPQKTSQAAQRTAKSRASATTAALFAPWAEPLSVHPIATAVPRTERSGEPSAGDLRLREAKTRDEIEALADLWRDLAARSECETPFVGFAWASTWLECFGDDHEPRILVIEDDAGPCGIAPLAIARRRLGPLGYRSVELIGTGALPFLGMGIADRTDFLLARRREECVRAVVRYLLDHRAAWDVVDLRFLPESGTTFRVLTGESPELGVNVDHELLAESPFLPLLAGYEDYLERRSSNFRNGVRRKLKKLQEVGALRFHFVTDPAHIGDALATAFEVAANSWKAKHGTGLFGHPKIRAFFSRLVPRMAEHGDIEIAALSLDGKPIASEVLFRVAGKIWSYDHSFGTDHARLSPGHLLTAHIIERAYQEQALEYDFLRGDEGYKYRWLGDARREQQVVLDHGGGYAKLVKAVAFRAKWAAKRSATLRRLQERAAGLANRVLSR